MKKYLKFTFLVLFTVLASVAGCGGKDDNGSQEKKKSEEKIDPRAVRKNENVLNLATYNVGVFNKSGVNSSESVARMMKTLDLDALSLNELDSCNTRSGRSVYQLRNFADLMGSWNYNFAGAIAYREGTYGIGAVTPRKIVNKWAIKLPKSNDKEVRALSVIETEKFVFCNTHLGLTEKSQADQIKVINTFVTENFANCGKPVFLCGDMNAEPGSAAINLLQESWTILNDTGSNTFSTSNPIKCIDYIMLLKAGKGCNLIRTFVGTDLDNGAVVSASDHFPVFVQVELK